MRGTGGQHKNAGQTFVARALFDALEHLLAISLALRLGGDRQSGHLASVLV